MSTQTDDKQFIGSETDPSLISSLNCLRGFTPTTWESTCDLWEWLNGLIKFAKVSFSSSNISLGHILFWRQLFPLWLVPPTLLTAPLFSLPVFVNFLRNRMVEDQRHSDNLIYATLFKKKFAKVFGWDSKANKCIQACLDSEDHQVESLSWYTSISYMLVIVFFRLTWSKWSSWENSWTR